MNILKKLFKITNKEVEKNLSTTVETKCNKVSKAYLVGSDIIKSGDISIIVNAAYDTVNKYEKAKTLQPFMFGIHGYDNISVPLCAVPEVRKWSAKLYREVPSILGLIDSQAIYWFLPCIAHIEIVNVGSSQTQIRWPVDLANFINEIGTESERIFRKISSTQEEVDQLYKEFLERLQTATKKLGL